MRSFEEYKALINENLTSFIPEVNKYSATVRDAMKYSLEIGGKRLRPVLLLAACDFAGGNIEEALPYAAALEYIHTYSLIHDDLPAMDNDDFRRGKPTNHKVYGEAMAVLAGDGLLNTAAEVIASQLSLYFNNHDKLVNHAKAGAEIIRRAGINGMIGGQVADVENEYNTADSVLVEYIEEHKCGDLITAPVVAGLLLAGAEQHIIDDFEKYAMNMGIAFQVLDDILDFEGDEKLIGKKVGKDKDIGKCNYVCVHSLDDAKAQLAQLTEAAVDALAKYGKSAEFFTELAEAMKIRKA
ncbi:MAG: polyprenyl synthetase family protein [Clostridiales bacterium]|nr:polyprenyl synthetase family protein [Candidatus Crickella caballi]